MQRRKILVLASTFPRWENDATPPFVFELEKRMTNDFDIFLLAPHFVGAKKRENLENIKVTRFQYFWPASLQKLCYEGGIMPNIKKNKLLVVEAFTLILFELFEAIRIVKKEKIAIIHAHWIIPQGIVAVVIKKLFGVPYIVTTHGGDIYGLQTGIMKYLKKLVLENAKRITVVSTAIKEEIVENINPNLIIDVISMGVDSKLFNPKKYDKAIKKKYNIDGPFLLFVGRLAEGKGVRYLIQAMPLIINKFPTAKLLIIGKGTIDGELQSLSQKLGVAKKVLFVGALPNDELPKYYATADFFIGPSTLQEGLGLTFVEASLSGAIPIGTNVGGISDVIQDSRTGYLVKPRDAQGIADMIIKLINNNHIMKIMRVNSRKESIKKFDWEVVSNKYRQVYLND